MIQTIFEQVKGKRAVVSHGDGWYEKRGCSGLFGWLRTFIVVDNPEPYTASQGWTAEEVLAVARHAIQQRQQRKAAPEQAAAILLIGEAIETLVNGKETHEQEEAKEEDQDGEGEVPVVRKEPALRGE